MRVHGAGEYPERLRDAAHPVGLLYDQGWWDLAYSRSVAVVGTRKPSRTRRFVRTESTDAVHDMEIRPCPEEIEASTASTRC
ncbi:MAG: DNA-processing protein DprA [Alphaproteobacteria bacterium]|nr:DNA-processing protein DprA [Alphaproteobacteria bacterium]